MLIVDVPADYIFDPGDVGRGACEHRGLLIHNASNRTKAGYTMNFPRTTRGILAHQRTTWISLSESRINSKNTISMLSPCVYIYPVWWDLFYLADRLELIRQGITTADHRGLDLEPPVIHPLAGVIWHNRQGDLVKGLCNFSIRWITWWSHKTIQIQLQKPSTWHTEAHKHRRYLHIKSSRGHANYVTIIF